MTPEQFVFWLSGYMTAGKDNDHESLVEDIVQALKQVVNPSFPKVAMFLTGMEYE